MNALNEQIHCEPFKEERLQHFCLVCTWHNFRPYVTDISRLLWSYYGWNNMWSKSVKKFPEKVKRISFYFIFWRFFILLRTFSGANSTTVCDTGLSSVGSAWRFSRFGRVVMSFLCSYPCNKMLNTKSFLFGTVVHWISFTASSVSVRRSSNVKSFPTHHYKNIRESSNILIHQLFPDNF